MGRKGALRSRPDIGRVGELRPAAARPGLIFTPESLLIESMLWHANQCFSIGSTVGRACALGESPRLDKANDNQSRNVAKELFG